MDSHQARYAIECLRAVATFTEQGKFIEALEVLDSHLSLGQDDVENMKKLQELMSSIGKEAVSSLIVYRGKTIADILLMLHKPPQSGGVDDATRNSIIHTLYPKIEQQFVIVEDIFSDDAANLAFIGQILFLMFEPEKASVFIERALKINPSEGTACLVKEIIERNKGK